MTVKVFTDKPFSWRMLVTCIAALSMCSMLAAVQIDVSSVEWNYRVSDGKVTLGGGSGNPAIPISTAGDLVIPETIDGYPVVTIGEYAFANCSLLTSVTIPSSVELIDAHAFSDCGSLTSVQWNEGSLRTLKNHAFSGCTALANVAIPNGVTEMGNNVFLHCHSLTNAVIPTSVTNIGQYAFSYCNHLESLTLPFIGSQRGNDRTDEAVFGHIFGLRANEGLTNVVQTYDSSSTITRYIPVSLKRIVISDEELIAKGAFDNCTMIAEIDINDGVTIIDEWAFNACALTEMTIPNSVTSIGYGILGRCGRLKKLKLPFIGSQRGIKDSPEAVFGRIFGNPSSFPEYMPLIQHYDSADKTKTTTRKVPKTLNSVEITDETFVPYGAFENCSNLTSVVIGNSVTNIAKGAFAGCGGLQSMTLPFIGSERGLSDVPESVLGYVFGADQFSGGRRMIQHYTGDGNSPTTTNYLPSVLKEIRITDETVVGYGAFYGLNMLTNIVLNEGIKSIGGYSFRNCMWIKNIVIPDSVKQLDVAAFRGSGLESIFVPLGVMDMSSWTFESCSSLHLAYVPRRFKGNIGYNTFANCAADLQVIYYDENMRFFDETLRTKDNSSTNIVAVCTNGCRVTFEWKCSCEPVIKGRVYDYLSFSIDGVQQSYICGETGWTTNMFTVTGDGEHVFTWTYQKDEEGADGEDCAWVKQVVVAPLVTLSFDGDEAESGTVPADMSFYADDDTAILPGCGTLALTNHSFAGWSDGEMVYAAGSACPYLKAEQTLTAVWAANTLSAPVITAPATYEADSATVTITADEGANIYYTLDGSLPDPARPEAVPYLGPFEVEGSATVRAIAVRDNYFDSEVSQFEVTRLTWTFGEYLNCPERTFTTDGNAEWVRAKGVSADGFALQSGAITHSQTSRLETVVYGAGTVTFRCKVDGEIVKKIVYDGLAFCVDGVQQGDLIGDADWTNKTFMVSGDERHVLGWLYVKDEDGNGGGEDCAWLDCVSWTADDPLPALDISATDNDAMAIIGGLSDVRLSEKIVGTTTYGAFRTWVDGKGLVHAAVRDAPNAWLSYALDAPGLMVKATPLTSEDILIESIEPSGDTSEAFDLVVDIAGAEIGTAARLTEVLNVEGATELNESAFSSKGLSFILQRTADGKIKATVTPAGSPPAFFIRVKVK